MIEEGREPGWRLEWWVPTCYALLSAAYIYGSDTLVAAIAGSMERQRAFSVYKGLGFVLVTAVLLHAGLRWALRRERASARRVRDSLSTLDTVLHTVPQSIFWKDSEGRYLGCNRVFAQAVGLDDPARIVGRTDFDLPWSRAEAEAYRADDREVIETNRPKLHIIERLQQADGARLWIDTSKAPLRDGSGRACGVLGIYEDITERKRTQEALQESEERYRTQFDRASEGIFTLSSDGDLLEVNEAFARMHGRTPDEMLGMNLRDLDTPASSQLAPERMRRLLAGEALTYEVEHVHKDGHAFPMEVSAGLVSMGGSPVLLCFHRDITERKQAEAELRALQTQLMQAQKMESLGSLAGGVAHDMNNVLGAILGMASAHLETQPENSSAFRAFDTIAKAAVRGGKMVKSLLRFARQSPMERQDLDLNAILSEEVQLLERTTLSKVRLELDLAQDLQLVRGDAASLAHAFMNLCINAVDAMPDGGRLSFRTRNVDDDWVEVEVEDTGIGMAKATLERAMDPYFTTKETGKGTGLGLSMVYSTVTGHQGQIEIRSEPGQGTCVRIRFPACEPTAPVAEPAAEFRAEPARGALKVLLVDDDELIQSTLQAVLKVLGHSVTAVLSGEAALLELEAGLRPDVVILDLNMPGLGGSGTLPRLRALRPTLPVLLATGRADQTARNLAEAHPFVTLVSKPFTIGELQKHLEPIGRG